MPLHLTYRPQTLEQLYGNESVKASVKSILERQDRPRSWLFTGPSGTGKTTAARIVANMMGCHERDYEELNIADARGIDDARRIMSSMGYMPQGRFDDGSYGQVRVLVLDEVQQSTKDFQQALLKSLEDTPSHMVFILCTTDPDKLLRTIRTRCTTFTMSPLPGPDMRDLVADVLAAEGVQWPQETVQAVCQAVTEVADGSPRQALVVLDQVIDLASEEAILAVVGKAQAVQSSLKELAQALLRGPTQEKDQGWSGIAGIIKTLPEGDDPERVRRYVFAAAEGQLLRDGSEQAGIVCNCFNEPFYNNAGKGLVFACWRCLR